MAASTSTLAGVLGAGAGAVGARAAGAGRTAAGAGGNGSFSDKANSSSSTTGCCAAGNSNHTKAPARPRHNKVNKPATTQDWVSTMYAPGRIATTLKRLPGMVLVAGSSSV